VKSILPIPPPRPREETKLILINRGIKLTGGMLPKAFYYVDCRGLPDSAAGEGPGGSGDTPAAQAYIMQQAGTSIMNMVALVDGAVQRLPIRRRNEKDPYGSPIVICCFCAFGLNRSRAAKHLIAAELRKLGYQVEVSWLTTSKEGVPYVSMED